MPNRMLRHLLLLILSLVTSVSAAKGKTKTHVSTAAKTYKGDGKKRSDLEMRTLVRKQAPFYLEERFRGDTIRINKDGTFSREGEAGGYATEGHWKIASGKMKLKWANGEEYGYRLAFSGRTPLVAGRKPNKERHYVIVTAD